MLRRRMLIMLGVVLLVVLLLAGYKGFSVYQQIQMFSAPKPPVSVAVATAIERPWQARLPTVGTLKALQGVDLSLEATEARDSASVIAQPLKTLAEGAALAAALAAGSLQPAMNRPAAPSVAPSRWRRVSAVWENMAVTGSGRSTARRTAVTGGSTRSGRSCARARRSSCATGPTHSHRSRCSGRWRWPGRTSRSCAS